MLGGNVDNEAHGKRGRHRAEGPFHVADKRNWKR